MINTFKDLKELVRGARLEAKREGLEVSRVVRSRGAWLCACDDEELMSENQEDDFTTLESLNDFMVAYLSEGATSICIDGGYDGAHNVSELIEVGDYEPWVSSWSVEVWTKADGWLV